MNLLLDTLGFAAKGLIVFVTAVATAVVIAAIARRRRDAAPTLEVTPLNERFEFLRDSLVMATADKKGRKELAALRRARHKSDPPQRANVYVLDFDGDVLATSVVNLREEVTAVLQAAREGDEVVLRLESAGGAVAHYGLAAAQLARLKDRRIKLTVCIDRVAASGGYMMACVADAIVASPFAIVGSIGVITQIPNVRKLLERHDVHVEELTAGEFKRTVTVFGEVTDKGRQKLREQLEETHAHFKGFIRAHRPALDLDRVATGEHWLAVRAKELGLVDALRTSDDLLLERASGSNLYALRYQPAHPWRQRLAMTAAELVDRALVRLLSRARTANLPS